jgi:dihydrodipicolinate synthase/N-acetylneuraminate lyase
MQAVPPIHRGRKVTGMSAILLPMASADAIDWQGFRDHVQRTAAAGLVPAINMDTGYGHLLTESQREQVLRESQALMGGKPYVAGAFVADQPDAAFAFDQYRRRIDQIHAFGGTPIIFQSYGLTQQADDGIIDSYRRIADHAGPFYAFELGKMFAPFGSIYSLEVYRRLMEIPQCLGAKHSSLSRRQEWERLALRDRYRPDFKVLTGNDLAIDMIMYGSDYLLGLSTFAPAEFALRDRFWEAGNSDFYELNDLLQYLGFFAFRSPVPAYKHSAAQFLKARGWIATSLTYPGSPLRPDADVPILEEIVGRLAIFGCA